MSQLCGLKKLPTVANLRSLAVIAYASLLVHEATHALLEKRRFPLTKANKARIEKLCDKEEARFLVSFPDIDRRLALAFGREPTSHEIFAKQEVGRKGH